MQLRDIVNENSEVKSIIEQEFELDIHDYVMLARLESRSHLRNGENKEIYLRDTTPETLCVTSEYTTDGAYVFFSMALNDIKQHMTVDETNRNAYNRLADMFSEYQLAKRKHQEKRAKIGSVPALNQKERAEQSKQLLGMDDAFTGKYEQKVKSVLESMSHDFYTQMQNSIKATRKRIRAYREMSQDKYSLIADEYGDNAKTVFQNARLTIAHGIGGIYNDLIEIGVLPTPQRI